MLDINYTTQENAIEEVFYNFLKDCQTEPLSENLSDSLTYLNMIPIEVKFSKEEKNFIFQIIEKRVENCFTFKFTDERAIMALCLWCESAGKAIMYLWYIQAWCFKNNKKEINLTNLWIDIFPNGLFYEKDLETVWEKQKVEHSYMGSDNLIDYGIAGLSIQFKN